jgi:hypothetical protein
MRRNILVALVLLAVFLLGGFTFAQTIKQQWEYKVENGVAEKRFNDLGSQGWELVSCGQFNGGMPYCVFKRLR